MYSGGVGTTAGGAAHNDAVDFFFRTKGLNALFTQIELSLSASKLLDRDIVSKSDPIAVVYIKKRDGALEELGRTEVIMNSLEPAWIEKINVAYQFEIVQQLVFHVYDVDTRYHNLHVKTLKLKDQEFLGEASCAISEIVTKQSQSLTLNLHNKNGQRGLKNLGTLTVHAEETVASRNAVEITFRCSHLDNKDLFSKSVLKGQLFVDGFCEKKLYSFLDYISSGFELNFMVAVDFTAMVGTHKIYPEKAHYVVEGLEGIMAAYASALRNVALAGPTLFRQVINTAAEIAGRSLSQGSNKYFVLLIITSSTGRIATRDIVQFVPMRDVHGGHMSIVQSLLEELPGQFLTYMRSKDIKPHNVNLAQASVQDHPV
ncbi:Protein BONZAI 3 [Camellia lanceoleosa]|uniref:Protein BONZAI 3 n=1 Tax=Camellia lanceoleosa TaxID=1840588 RepID=A0ACC0IH64_9ERIC|nr:Protein BONZAI 3 [Camellia lanceoleosa]